MNSFDSTFEALAFHYVGFGLFTVVNNVWTIVALITAAVSFWRLRGASLPVQLPFDRRLESSPVRESTSTAVDSRSRSSFLDVDAGTTTMTMTTTSATTSATAVSAGAVFPPSPRITAAPSACDGVDVTKGKFVVYYREDDRCDEAADEEEVVKESGDKMSCRGDSDWMEGWEKALRLRSNGVEKGMGWYDYQDLAVLSGSVVRLWEEEKRQLVLASSMTSAAACCVVW